MSKSKTTLHEIYQAERITERLTRIACPGAVFVYLLEGTERAALIDTAYGDYDLAQYVRSLTDKPLIVILTHGHYDHAYGTSGFDKVYMNTADREIFLHFGGEENLEQRKAEYKRFHTLSDGMVFELGDISLMIYDLPGHTPGCTTVLVPEERILITGDACGDCVFLFLENCSSVTEYRHTLEVYKERVAGKYDRVLLFHGSGETDLDIVTLNIRICDDILARNVDDVPFVFRGELHPKALVAKALTEDRKRIDGGVGNIIYNPQHIR